MNPNKFSNGDQLRVAILEYANAKITRVRIRSTLCFFSLFVVLILYLFGASADVLGIFAVVSIVLTAWGIYSIFGSDTFLNSYGSYYYQELINLIENSVTHFIADDEYKFLIIEFFVPSKNLVNKNKETKYLFQSIFYTLLPHYYRTEWKMYVEFYVLPSLNIQAENSIMDELERIVDSDLDRNSSGLPFDIKTKGKEMSRAYLMLYCIENTLRLFIESEEKKMNQPLTITNSVRNKIAGRRTNESQNKYLSVRGTSDLFYMDFKELGDVIVNNPELLSQFPSENWVKVKIEELGNVRNLIAHNSYIGEHELKIIAINYESILRQIRKLK